MLETSVWIWVVVAVGIVLVLIALILLLKKYLQGGQFKKPTKITGRVVLITGANTGIGKETALDLAGRGAKVYLACRDHERGEAARIEIIEKTGNHNVFNRKLDLSSFESIKTFCEDFKSEESKLDVLINNAGYFGEKRLTKENFEMCIGVNHLGHFLLTKQLLEHVRNASPSRIIVVSSTAHTSGTINKEDLNSEKSYDNLNAYTQSKLANILFTRNLANKLKGTGVVVNSLHPGVVATEFLRNIPKIFSPLVGFLRLFFKTPKSGAQTTICLAVDPELEYVTGKYFSDCKEKECGAQAKDEETSEWLWNISEELTGVKF